MRKILVTKLIEIYLHHIIQEMRKILVTKHIEIYLHHIIREMRMILVTKHIERDLFSSYKMGNEDFGYQGH